jgi:hypothetical protein
VKHAAGFKQLVRELGVHGEERRELSDRLQQLVMSGKLVRLDADRFAIPQRTRWQADSPCTAMDTVS